MLFYETFGSDPVTPLIFLHGFLGSRLDWVPMIESLQNRYRCIAVDLPSHGKSPYFDDVFAALEKTLLSLSEDSLPILVGYSLGGRLALNYGNKHPEKIKGLIALSSHTGLKTKLEKHERKKKDLLWEERLKTLSSDEFLKLWYKQPVFASLQKRPELLKELLERRSYQNGLELANVLNQVSLRKQSLYDTFRHPVHFLFGEEDGAYVDLYSSIPSSLKKEIKNAGHPVHLENPMACIGAIQEIIGNI
jgi:2-succinyl-6-hydroxy-2,4-cyclohexadiene-1-carboxylate synthase